MHQFRAAVEADDLEAIAALLAEDVVFLGSVAFTPYEGRDLVAAILRGAGRALEDFRYEREIGNPGGSDYALVFKAWVGDRAVHGCEFLHLDGDGLIDKFVVMVRPLSAAHAAAEAMQAQFELVQRELGQAA
jgi:hypothetical protein